MTKKTMPSEELNAAVDALGDWFASQELKPAEAMQVMVRLMNRISVRIVSQRNKTNKSAEDQIQMMIDLIGAAMTMDMTLMILEAKEDDKKPN